MVHSHWEHRTGWRMLKREQKILDASKGKGGFRVSKMVFTGNTAIILNIRHEFKLAFALCPTAS